MRNYLRKHYISAKYHKEPVKKYVLAEKITGNKEKAAFLAAGQKMWRGNTELDAWKRDLSLLKENKKCQQLGNKWKADMTVSRTFFENT